MNYRFHIYLIDFTEKLQLPGSARNETVLMLQGITGSGKSTLGNFILQRNAFNVEASLMSVTEKAEMASGTLQQRCIHVIDMPGLGDTSQLGSVAVTEGQEFANEIAKLAIEFSRSLIMAKKGIHSFLITCRSDSRDQYGTRRLLQYMDILGNFWSHSILCLTHGKALGSSDEVQRNNLVSALQHKTKAPLILRELLEKADGRYIIVESEWQGCAEYQRQKVEELLQLSDDIVEKYGTYNDALLNLGLQHYEKAKMELRHQYDDPNGPEIEEAAFEVATRSLGRILYDLIVKRFAEGDDAENLRKLADIKIKELEIVNRENERLLLQLQEEKEEKRRIEEDMARMKREREAAEAKAEEKERELQKYLKKPTFSERRIKDYGPTICLRGIEVRFSAEAIDEATGIKGKGKNLKSRSGAKKHAREDLKRILLDKDIIRKD